MSTRSRLASLISNPYVPGVLLTLACLRAAFGTPTWRTYVAIVANVIWLAFEIKERRAKRSTLMAAQDGQARGELASASGAPSVGSAEHAAQMHEARKVMRQMLAARNAPPPPVPTEDEIRATIQPAISVHRAPFPVPLVHPARSYIGGLPQLPPELEWPEKETYERFALTFLAQIDLTELPAVDASPLPRAGVLFFFMDTNIECPEPSDCRVLYWPGNVTSVAARDLPANARMYGGAGGEPWPWLPAESVWSRTGFRFPVEFVAFDSFRAFFIDEKREYPPPRNETAFEKVMGDEYTKRFGAPETPPGNFWPGIKVGPENDWAFAWIAVEYGARSLVHTIDDALRRHEAAEATAEYERLKNAAAKWIERASGEVSCAPCDEATRAEFLQEWRALAAEVNTISARLKVYGADPTRDLVNVVVASCYFCAANGAQNVIPEIHRSALASLSHVALTFTRHQMLGHGEPVQSSTHDRHDQILLLQIKGDDALGWNSNSGCVLQFWITPEALERRAFDTVEVTMECD